MCSSGHGVVRHCCPCECPCYLGLVKSTGVQVCNPCGCPCGVCENGVGGLKCCGNCPSSGTCFQAIARVTLESGKSLAMFELQIGDKVKTGKDVSLIWIHILYIRGNFQQRQRIVTLCNKLIFILENNQLNIHNIEICSSLINSN